MRLLLVSLLLIFMSLPEISAQIEVPFNVKTLNYTTRKKESGVVVKVYQGGSVIQTYTSDGTGEVKLKLPAGKKYKIEVSKAGKVSRSVSVDVTNVNDELIQGTATPQGAVEMSLFDETPGVDYSYVTSNVATEFYFDGKSAELQYDQVLAEKMIKKVEKIMKDTEAAKGQSDAQYNTLIKQADGLFAQKKYQEALASYEQALALKPKEAHPAQRINEIDGILKAEKASAQQNAQAQQEYDNLITAADNLFNQKKFEEAKARYQEALTKKQEQHPKDQIVKCDSEIARLKKEAENVQKYTDAIKAADAFYTQKSYQAAKDKYKEALKWKAADPHATTRLADIDGKLNTQKAEQDKKKKYDEANAAGDALMAQEKWTEAKSKYNEALVIEPASTYTQGKIKEIDGKLAEIEKEKAKQEQITKLLTEGNTAFTASQWAASKTKYQEVLKLDAANATASARITEIDAKIAGEKADVEKTAKIKQLITEGDALAKQTKLPEAKAKYQEALTMKPDPAVQAKIDALDAQIAANAKKAEQKQQYDKAMADGEAAFAASNWAGAKAKFQEAQSMDPVQALPKQRIADTDKKIAEGLANAQKAEKYAAAMTAGNAALNAGQLPEAKAKFQEAIAADGTKPEAKEKLAQVDKLLADQAAKQANQAKYDAAVKAGADLLAAKKLNEAKAKFTEAQTLDPSQALPKQKIAEIDGLLAGAEKQKQIDGLLKEGDVALGKKDVAGARTKYQQVLTLDPSNTTASAKLQEVAKLENDLAGEAQKEARFKQLKEEATSLMAQQKYAEAKQKLSETKVIKQDSQVDQLITQCDAKIAELAQSAEKEKQYNTLITEAQGLESSKQYDQAIAKYNEALKIKNEQLPKDRIAAIGKIKEGDANQLKFEAAMKAGNELLAAKKLNEAKAKFQEAQTIDPTQVTPKQKIAEIDGLLAGAEKQKQIDALLKEGDAALAKKELSGARTKYQQVLTLDPSNTTASAKLQEVAKLENDLAGEAQKEARFKQLKEEATSLMAQQKYAEAKQKLTETKAIKQDAQVDQLIVQCDTKMAELSQNAEKDKQYNALIAEAQSLESAKQYDQALVKYNEALKLKNEQLPKDRIAAINQIKNANASQAKLDADYAAAMKRGNDAFGTKNYTDAIKAFNEALALKPTEKEPADKAAEAQRLAQKESATTEDAAYQKILDVGQKAIDEKNYEKAREMYNRALTFRANDPLPKQKLTEIDGLVKAEEDAKKKQVAYTAKITEAESTAKSGNLQGAITLFEQAKTIKQDEVLPDNRIAELRAQLEGKNAVAEAEAKRYRELMDAGATAEGVKDYSLALGKYKEALAAKPKDKAAQDKVAEMQQLLDNAAKSDARKTEIQKLIAKADAKFKDGKWMDAKVYYENVLTIDGSNEYAKSQIRICDQKSIEKTTEEEKREYQKIITKANENFDSKNYDRAIELYKRALSFRANDPYPKQRLAEIDAILNPKPVVASKEPEKLENLGNPTDNSIIEGETALQAAERKRKARRYSRFKRGAEETLEKTDSLMTVQGVNTTQTNLALGEITKENSGQAEASDEKRQENIKVLSDVDSEISAVALENEQYKTAEHLDVKGQIETANRIAIEEGSILNGNSAENNELIKTTSTEQQNSEGEVGSGAYEQRLDNEKEYMNIQLTLEQNAIDDTQERILTEYLVRKANQSVIEVTDENQQRTNQSLEMVKAEVEDVTAEIAEIRYEETKQSPLNDEEIKKIETSHSEISQKDNEDHLQSTLTYRGYVEEMDAEIKASEGARDEARQNNVNVVQDIQVSQEEIERETYNELMVKTLTTDGAIKAEIVSLDEFAEVTQTAPDENTEKIRLINDSKLEQDREAAEGQVEKHQENQASINATTQTVSENSSKNAEQAGQNAEVIKDTKSSLGATEKAQTEKQENKTQSAKQLLAAIEKQEIVYDEQVANDLGKLYPEGVSQEQFEQNDEDGLLKAVVTRRIVVKNGHGDVYVRIQTLSGLTYTKNGQPTTEHVWQRETQDALLQRNY